GSKVFGTPAKAIKASFRLEAMVQRLPKMRDSLTELAETVSRLEQEIEALQNSGASNASEEEN
ncbi:MAG: polyhydroxyalkanoate synthesis regulator phasin, partial [Candidatus Krumholzibacteriia bacterium]